MVADGRQRPKMVRRHGHRAGGLQIPERWNEMRRAFARIWRAFEGGLRGFREASWGLLRLLKFLSLPARAFCGRARFCHAANMAGIARGFQPETAAAGTATGRDKLQMTRNWVALPRLF
jgi:hypothetical protein